MNNCVFIGRLCADPEIRTTTSGHEVCSFRMAIYRNKENSDFFQFVAWNKTANLICQFFGKGNMLAVTARAQNRDFEDKSGAKRTVTEFVVTSIDFIPQAENGAKTAEKQTDDAPQGYTDDDDLPF